MAAARFVGNGVADMLRDSCAYGALTFHLLLNGLMRQKQGCLTRDKTASFPLICCRQRLMNPTGLRANLQEHTYTARDMAVPGRTVCCWWSALWPVPRRTPSPAVVPSSERTSRSEDRLRRPQTAELKHKPTMSSPPRQVFLRRSRRPVLSWKPLVGPGRHGATGTGRAVTMGRYCRRSAISLSRPYDSKASRTTGGG